MASFIAAALIAAQNHIPIWRRDEKKERCTRLSFHLLQLNKTNPFWEITAHNFHYRWIWTKESGGKYFNSFSNEDEKFKGISTMPKNNCSISICWRNDCSPIQNFTVIEMKLMAYFAHSSWSLQNKAWSLHLGFDSEESRPSAEEFHWKSTNCRYCLNKIRLNVWIIILKWNHNIFPLVAYCEKNAKNVNTFPSNRMLVGSNFGYHLQRESPMKTFFFLFWTNTLHVVIELWELRSNDSKWTQKNTKKRNFPIFFSFAEQKMPMKYSYKIRIY